MIDCGEGTQLQIRKSRQNFSKLYAVFISHMHGDHVLGLIGMLSTFGLNGRTAPLRVYAPSYYEELFNMELKMFCSNLDYEIIFCPVDTNIQKVIYEDRTLTVETIPLKHRVPCCGFLFREKAGDRHLRRDIADFYGVPVSQYNNIRCGMDWVSPTGDVIDNSLLSADPDPQRSYAYCSDTAYLPELADRIKGTNLLYHEATYTEEYRSMAEKYLHSTARDAALIAGKAEVRQLLLGHFSKRYRNEQPLLDEAQAVFPDTILAKEGMVIDVL